PAGDRRALRLGLLRGVAGDAGRPGQGEADRPADEEERAVVLLVLAEVAGDAHAEVRMGDLTGAELRGRLLARHRGTAGERARPLMGLEVALVVGRPGWDAHGTNVSP